MKNTELTVFAGGNGAGKSTMLNTIAGVHKVDGGRILLDGQDITYKSETDRARYIGRVFQDPMMGTAPTMMIEENLAMAYRRTKKRGLGWGISSIAKSIIDHRGGNASAFDHSFGCPDKKKEKRRAEP